MSESQEDVVQTMPSHDEIAQQLERLLSHEIFRDSPTLQRLFSYIVAETLAGHHKDLKEYTLGVSVFKRGENFDPRTDSIARVQVGVLRKKLAAYYSGPGKDDDVIIDIPRGHYAAQFTRRAEPESEPFSPQKPAVTQKRWVREIAFGTAGILLGLALWFPYRAKETSAQPLNISAKEFPWKNHPLWNGYFEPESSTQLVVGAPMFFAFGGGYFRDSTINSVEEFERSEKMRKLGELLRTPARPEEIYTGLGETAGLYTLGRFFYQGGKELPLVRNRLTRWQDFAHSNLILLASFRFKALSQELDLPRDFEFDMEKTLIRNLHPAPGEQEIYKPFMANGNNDYDFAIVSVWPSPQSGRRVMTIRGVFTWGTQGAADYVVDPPSLRDLDRRLRKDHAHNDTDGLQILLKVLVKDRQPIAANYVTHHWLGKPGS